MVLFIGNKGDYSTNVQYADIQECVEYCSSKSVLGIDIETTKKKLDKSIRIDIYQPGLDPYLTDIVMLQIGDLERIYVIDVRVVDISPLLSVLNSNILFVGQNLRFEAKHLKHKYGVIFKRIWDIMIVEQCLFNGMKQSYSLQAIAERRLGIPSIDSVDLFNDFDEEGDYIDKSVRTEFLSIGDRPFTERQILYGYEDIHMPLKIRDLQLEGRVIEEQRWLPTNLFDLENEFVLVLADLELNGITFDPDLWLDTANQKQIVYEHRLKRLNDYVVSKYYGTRFVETPDLFGSELKCGIQWSSSKQVVDFFRFLKFCPKEKSKQTKKMEYSVSFKALNKLLPKSHKELLFADKEPDSIENHSDLILLYLLYKESEQAITTFGKDWLKYIHPITNRIHPTFKQLMHTGRMASSKPNSQNLPSEFLYRRCFIPKEGHVLINSDFSSQESRILADVSADPSMISFFNDGHPIHGSDYHSFTATKLYSIIRNDPSLIINKKDHPEERSNAKSVSFLIAYGGSAFALKDTIGESEEVAQALIDSYFEAFPTLGEVFQKAKDQVMKKGYILIDPFTGRMYFDMEFKRMNELGTKIWSYYPDNYRYMNQIQKQEAKDHINRLFPQVKDMWSEYFALKGSLERKGLNYPIQGLAGSQSKKAAVLLRREIINNNLQDKIQLTNIIHDEFLAEAAEDYQEEARYLVEKCMIDGANEFCTHVKMAAEAVIVPYWHH